MIIGVFYRHPEKKDTNFTEWISKTLDKIKKKNKKVIVCGDFNFYLLNYDKNECVNSFYIFHCKFRAVLCLSKNIFHSISYLNTMLQNSLQPCILEPTRIVNNHRPSLVVTYVCYFCWLSTSQSGWTVERPPSGFSDLKCEITEINHVNYWICIDSSCCCIPG